MALPNFLILVIEQMPAFSSSEHTQHVTFTWQSSDRFNFTYPIIFEEWKEMKNSSFLNLQS